jgi:hypothetical protein
MAAFSRQTAYLVDLSAVASGHCFETLISAGVSKLFCLKNAVDIGVYSKATS